MRTLPASLPGATRPPRALPWSLVISRRPQGVEGESNRRAQCWELGFARNEASSAIIRYFRENQRKTLDRYPNQNLHNGIVIPKSLATRDLRRVFFGQEIASSVSAIAVTNRRYDAIFWRAEELSVRTRVKAEHK